MLMKKYLALILIIFVAVISYAEEESPSLKFLVSGKVIEEVSLIELKDKLKIHKIEFSDPIYEKEKRYGGFELRDVLQFGFGDEWKSSEFTDVAFEALDGYVSVSSISKLKEAGGYIVF